MEIGGAQILLVDMLNDLCVTNDVSLIIINAKVNMQLVQQLNTKVSVFYIRRPVGSLNPFYLFKLNSLIWRIKPDVLHSHERKIVKMIWKKNLKTIFTIHDVNVPIQYLDLYNNLVAISFTVLNDIKSRSALNPAMIYNGIPMESFSKRSDYEMSDKKLFRIVQVSRLMHEKKGQDILLHAMKILIDNYGLSNISLELVGEGDSKGFLIELAKDLGLESKVIFLGNKNREWIYANLSSYHLLVQPSRYEGFGLTIVEGLAAGLPVLATNIDGPNEILKTLPAGSTFFNEDSMDCAKEIIAIYSDYTNGTIKEKVFSSKNLIIEKFSIQATTSQYLKIYKN